MARNMAKLVWVAKEEAATLLVWGFEQHGKSSFIDSVMRHMYKENENLVRRAGSRPPDKYSVLHVFDDDKQNYVDLSKEVLFRLVDSPRVASEGESKSELLRVLEQGVWHKMKLGEETDAKCKHRLRPDCVILVVSSTGCNLSELRALADILHETGTPFVVAVTNKDRTTESEYLDSYLHQVASACRNESVFCLENYVQRPHRQLFYVEQNDDADYVMSKLLVQALEYVWEDRINDMFYSNVTPKKCYEEEPYEPYTEADNPTEESEFVCI